MSTFEYSKPNQFVGVDSFLQNGTSSLETKEPLAVLKNFEFQEANFKSYLKRLTAKLQYYRCQQDSGQIFGTFKLATDPRGEQFSNEKIIFQGSVLHSDFVVGVVLFNGKKCLPSELWTLSSVFRHHKLSTVHQKQRTFASLMVVLSLMCCFYSKLAAIRVEAFLVSPLRDIKAPSSFSTYISLYFSCFVLWLNTLINLACLLQGLLLQQEFNRGVMNDLPKPDQPAANVGKSGKELKILKKSANPSDAELRPKEKVKFEVFDPTVLPDLGCIDDIIFDKSGTLVDNQFQVATIATKNHFYHANQEPGFLIDHSQVEILDVSDISPEMVFGEFEPKSAAGNGVQTESKKVILVNVEDKKQVMSGMGAGKPVNAPNGVFKFGKPETPDQTEAFGKQAPLSQMYQSSKFTHKQSNLGIENAQVGWSEVKAGPLMTTDINPSSAQIPIEELDPALAEGNKVTVVESHFQKFANRPVPISTKPLFEKKSDRSIKSPKSSKGGKHDAQTPSSQYRKGQSNSPFKIELTSAKQEDAISIEEGVVTANESPDNLVKGVMHFLHEYQTREVSELLTMFSICQDSKFSDGK